MKTVLNLANCGQTLMESLVKSGNHSKALQVASQLKDVVEEYTPEQISIRVLAAQSAMFLEEYTLARKYLRNCLCQEPHRAELYALLAECHEEDHFGSVVQAAKYYFQAYRKDRTNDVYLASFGRAAVKANRTKIGVKALQTAGRRAGARIEVLRIVVDGLCCAGQAKAAVKLLQKLQFRTELEGEWAELMLLAKFEAARMAQTLEANRTVLPFVRVETGKVAKSDNDRIVRVDRGSKAPRPHVLSLRVRR